MAPQKRPIIEHIHARLANLRAAESQYQSFMTKAVTIDDVLDLARFEAGKLTLNPASVDLRGLVHDPMDLMAATARDKPVWLGYRVSPALPPRMECDPVRLRLLIPAVENSVSGNAFRPLDVVPTRKGISVEIGNTDAEGRLTLGDAICYASQKLDCDEMVDMATLTGAMVVSLGRHAIGMFSTDDALAGALEAAGGESHERVWRLPLWPEYGEMMKSEFADLKNISEVAEAGSITAAAFLREFAGDARWAHLDIAAVDNSKWPHPYLEKGASGIGVRLVTEALQRLPKK